jgi:4-amino-4-deoxy-L-arabinose transferase-like glycosyltransferase
LEADRPKPGHDSQGGERWVDRVLTTRRGLALLVAVLAGLLILPPLGLHPFFTTDEGQRAYPPLEMLQTGDFVVPRINGQPYLKKPPLLYWQNAAIFWVVGPGEWQARLVPALSGIGVAILAAFWVLPLSDRRAALLAGCMMSANYMVLFNSRDAQLDMPMTFFVTVALWTWGMAMNRQAAGQRGAGWLYLAGGCALSVAHLYKFPVPYLFVLSGWLGTVIVLRRWRWLLDWRPWLALVASAAPVALWAWLIVQRLGVDEVLAVWKLEAHRHLVHARSQNTGPIWYYAVRIPAAFIPWIALVPVLLTRSCRSPSGLRNVMHTHVWTSLVVSLSVLSLLDSKSTEYMLPAMPPLVVLLALAWRHATGAVIPAWMRPLGSAGFIRLGVALWCVVAWVGLPVQTSLRARQFDARRVAWRAREMIESGRPVAALHLTDTRSYVFFYLGRTVPNLEAPEEAAQFFENHPDGLVLTMRRRLRLLQERYGDRLRIVEQSAPRAEVFLVELTQAAGSRQ